MEIEFIKIFYVIALLILIFGIMTSSSEGYKTDSCRFPNCSASNKIPQFRTLVKDFSCLKTGRIKNALDNTNRFTISAILDVSSFNKNPEWQRLFHAGDYSSRRRTPGVWINQGYLHIRASAVGNWNDGRGCERISPPLEAGTHYHLVLVYDRNRIDVYLDGIKVKSCLTRGAIRPERDLFVGKWQHEREGANINMTLTYLPMALTAKDIASCWLYIKDLVKTPMSMKRQCNYSSHPCRKAVFIQNCKGQFLTTPSIGAAAVFTSKPNGNKSCFRLVQPVFKAKKGRHLGKTCSIESVAFPRHYLRHAGYIMRLNSKTSRSTNQHLKEDFLFGTTPGLNGMPKTVTFKAVQATFGGGCFYSDGRHLRFRSKHCPKDSKFADAASLNIGLVYNQIKLAKSATSSLKTGDIISLKSHHGKYLVAENDPRYTVRANRTRVGPWEKWVVNKTGDKQIALKSWRGRHLVSEPNFTTSANRPRVGPWEKWAVTMTGNRQLALKSWKNRYLVSEPNGHVRANRPRLGPWEKWSFKHH